MSTITAASASTRLRAPEKVTSRPDLEVFAYEHIASHLVTSEEAFIGATPTPRRIASGTGFTVQTSSYWAVRAVAGRVEPLKQLGIRPPAALIGTIARSRAQKGCPGPAAGVVFHYMGKYLALVEL